MSVYGITCKGNGSSATVFFKADDDETAKTKHQHVFDAWQETIRITNDDVSVHHEVQCFLKKFGADFVGVPVAVLTGQRPWDDSIAPIRRQSIRTPNTCLLYTSDAADE